MSLFQKNIKHLVLSGGGPNMLQILGSLDELSTNKILDLSKIESIYATSAGALVATLICLKHSFESIKKYLIERPWEKLFNLKVEDFIKLYNTKGLYGIDIFYKCFKPLLISKQLNLYITMREFFDYSKIEIHFYTFEINEYKLVDISYLTHPELKLIEALQMTCCLPLLVEPVIDDAKCYIDGGLSCNYPLNFCLNRENIDKNEILGFKNNYKTTKNVVNENSSVVEYIFNFLLKAIFYVNTDNLQPNIPNEIICDTNYMTYELLKKTLSDSKIRLDLYNDGIETAKKFILNLKKMQPEIQTQTEDEDEDKENLIN